MKQALQLKIGQSLTMTPQLQQAIRLLQLSALEMEQEIQEALESNPMLEVAEEDYDDRPDGSDPDVVDTPESADAVDDAARKSLKPNRSSFAESSGSGSMLATTECKPEGEPHHRTRNARSGKKNSRQKKVDGNSPFRKDAFRSYETSTCRRQEKRKGEIEKEGRSGLAASA